MSNKDSGFGCILPILLFTVMLVMFLLGRSTAPIKEITVENSNLTSYIEAAEKLKVNYKIENSGDKGSKITFYIGS